MTTMAYFYVRWAAAALCASLMTGLPLGWGEERRDAAGDPLPPAALLRQGSVRFSSPDGVMELLLSRDGQTLVSFGRLIIGWDAQSGRELWRQPSPVGYLPACYGNRPVTLDVDGSHFLLADHNASCLTRWDMRTGARTKTNMEFKIGPHGRAGTARAIDAAPRGARYFVGSGGGYRVFAADERVLFGEQELTLPAVEGERDRLTFGGAFCYGRFSPDGQHLALVTSQHPQRIELLAAETGESRGSWDCEHNVVRMEFAPDSASLAVTERDTAVRLYDCSTHQRMWECVFDVDKRSENYTSALAFTPDGKQLVVCERNQTIFKVDAASGEQIAAIRQHSWNPWAVAFTADGQSLFSSGWGGTIHQWDARSLDPLPLPQGVRGTDVITLSKDSQLCASVDQDGKIHVVSLLADQAETLLSVPNGDFAVVEFSRDSSVLAAGGSWGGEVHVLEWELATGKILKHWRWALGDDPVTSVEDIVFSPDDRRMLVSVFRQSSAYLLDRDSEERLGLPHQRVYGADFSPAGDRVYTAGWDKVLREWDGVTGELYGEQAVASKLADTRMYTVAAHPQGTTLAIATLNESIGLYASDSKELIREWDVGASFVFGALRFSPDGLWLVSGNTSGQILVWDTVSGQRLHTLEGHENHVYTLDFGSDNRLLCSGGGNVGYVWTLRPAELNCANREDALLQLLGEDPVAAYHAWWFLLEQGEASVVDLVACCTQVNNIYDIESMVGGSEPSQRERRRALLKQAVAADPGVVSLAAVQRIVSVISHVGTEASRQALNALARRDDALGQQAAWELQRLSGIDRR